MNLEEIFPLIFSRKCFFSDSLVSFSTKTFDISLAIEVQVTTRVLGVFSFFQNSSHYVSWEWFQNYPWGFFLFSFDGLTLGLNAVFRVFSARVFFFSDHEQSRLFAVRILEKIQSRYFTFRLLLLLLFKMSLTIRNQIVIFLEQIYSSSVALNLSLQLRFQKVHLILEKLFILHCVFFTKFPNKIVFPVCKKFIFNCFCKKFTLHSLKVLPCTIFLRKN